MGDATVVFWFQLIVFSNPLVALINLIVFIIAKISPTLRIYSFAFLICFVLWLPITVVGILLLILSAGLTGA